ncbi:MAG: SIMPL domain-containing protein [Acidobacteria bacterium]|nr:SIMPL domain-containing protein [Acidobacteriota bacterium]
MRSSQRIVAATAAAVLVAGVTAAGVRAAGGGGASDHDLLVSASARLASLGGLRAELAAVGTRTDALRRAVSALQPDPAAARGTITVIGEGRASATPDMMSATIGVSVRRATVQEALAAAETSARRVVGALKSRGVRSRDIQTEWVSLHSSTDRQGRPNGYGVQNHVRATIRDLRKAGRILGAAGTVKKISVAVFVDGKWIADPKAKNAWARSSRSRRGRARRTPPTACPQRHTPWSGDPRFRSSRAASRSRSR